MADHTGGIPVSEGGTPGGLVTRPGQLQYGQMLLGGGTSAGWRELAGWRDSPEGQSSDSQRPQSHGTYAGDVFAESVTVTFTFMLRGTPAEKIAALNTIEKYAPMDSVERCLAVDDGDGTWVRWGRLIGRQVPQDKHFSHAPVECSLQFLCADPRRYTLDESTHTVTLPVSSGGLEYPLTYPLDYGTSSSGAAVATNTGSIGTSPVVTFYGPLTDPILTTPVWSMGFRINLVDGERLVVDTNAGTALLNGTADRLYLIRNDSDPLERCLLPEGSTDLTLIAPAGTGRATVTYQHARM